MKIYLVGGAVRDSLLGVPVKDKDWVVVGATPKEMLEASYQQAGNYFPVFLHPQTHEEYALARTERKSGVGYTGFTCNAAPDVTLYQDLQRRDLTINALAQDEYGNILDPYGGQEDLQNRLLRHVSPAFADDPLRVLRVARFAARYAHLNFSISDKTMALMTAITEAGELEHLKPERVWKETEKALTSRNPQIFFQVLRYCGALKVLLPEVDVLFDEPAQAANCNTEVDTGIKNMMSLSIAAMLSSAVDVRFATLFNNIDKDKLLKHLLPLLHHNNCSGSVLAIVRLGLVEHVCQRLRVPNYISDLAKLVAECQDIIDQFSSLKPATIVKLFDKIDAWRKPQLVEKIALTRECLVDKGQGRLLLEVWNVVRYVNSKTVVEAGFKGSDIREELTKLRIKAVEQWKEQRCT